MYNINNIHQDLTTRYWKLKQGRPQRWQKYGVEDNWNESSVWTEEELEEKRNEIQERYKERSFQEGLNRMELKFRQQLHKR